MLLGLLTFPSFAQSFTYTYEGKILKYTVIDEEAKEVEVTAMTYTKPSGYLIIPSVVNDGSSDYTVTTIGSGAFYECSSLASVVIPNSVRRISNHAFYGCSSLASVEIPNSVMTIGHRAFGECTSLASVVIPNSVRTIDGYAFYGCSSLTSIEIPKSVKTIEDYVFYGCSSLASVVIPNSVRTISLYAFYGCSSLTSVVIPNSVKTIGSSAFTGCSRLASVVIPNSVERIGSSAFTGCSSLASIDVDPENEYYTSIDGVFFTKSELTIIKYPEGRANSSYTIPNSVETIGESAFGNCSKLTSVVIPDNVGTIEYRAFAGCEALRSVILPAGLKSLGWWVFISCPNIRNIVYRGTKPVGADYDTFDNWVYSEATLYVPKGTISLFEDTDPWWRFYNITDEECVGIDAVKADACETVEIYNLNGVYVGSDKSNLSTGIYIIRQGDKVEKIAVK